jgi:hypothetical protein
VLAQVAVTTAAGFKFINLVVAIEALIGCWPGFYVQHGGCCEF